MSLSQHQRESQERAATLVLALLDPVGAIVASIALAHYDVIAVQSLLHHGGGYRPFALLFFLGAALLVANPTALVAPIARGVGASARIFPKMRGKTLAFWLGVALVACAYVPLVTAWAQASLPYIDYTGTAALCLAALLAFCVGGGEAIASLGELLKSMLAHLRVSGSNRAQRQMLAGQLRLCGGVARGMFRERNVTVGAPAKGELLLYGEQSVRRGTIVIGAPGSSKTRSKVYPDFYWGLESSPRAGALVFVTKRRATQDCYRIARALRAADHIHIIGIGPDRSTMDITAGMTHESIGDAIQDGLGTSHSDFWRHGPSAFVEGFIEIVHALAPATIHVPALENKDGAVAPGSEAYDLTIDDTLPTLLKLISLDARRLDAVFAHGFQSANDLETTRPQQAMALRDLLHEVKGRVLPLLQRDAKLGEELRQSVLPQLQPFARGPLRDTFCDSRRGLDLSLLEQGHVILVEIDETEHPRAVGTVIRMIFRRIVQMARERTAAERVGYLDPIMLVCDEYTNYAASGHIQAWNTVRESNFCATVGITSISALTKQLGGDRNATDAIVANFANKFFFEIDDKATRDLARELIGQTTVLRRGTTKGTSKTHGSSSTASLSGGSHQSSGTSQSETESEHREEAIDGAIWRSLHAERDFATAIAFVRTGSGVSTDVVTLGVLDPAERIVTALPEAYGSA
ncbi:MAG TPA: TraM recognition domain-containing protein [Candidatus Acidoferrales bacterium]|nr:TraM recognition domain-containing protein [Candidatus Acidoferrales bacterium]